MGVVFSPDGRQVLSGGGDGELRLWEVGTGQLEKIIAQGRHEQSGRYGAACWEPATGKVLSMTGDAWRWLRRVSPGQYWPQPVLQADV